MLNIISMVNALENTMPKLGLSILPNKTKSIPERLKLLKKLKFELEKALKGHLRKKVRSNQNKPSRDPNERSLIWSSGMMIIVFVCRAFQILMLITRSAH